jgi:hypothetical protein
VIGKFISLRLCAWVMLAAGYSCCTLTWPGHDGIARNITMLPGDLVLYESHSVLHGVSCIEIEGGHD